MLKLVLKVIQYASSAFVVDDDGTVPEKDQTERKRVHMTKATCRSSPRRGTRFVCSGKDQEISVYLSTPLSRDEQEKLARAPADPLSSLIELAFTTLLGK